MPLLWLALQVSAVRSWAGPRRPDLCAERGRGPARGGAGRHGLTCLCGIGAAALYSSRGPSAGLGAERSPGVPGAGGRRAHRTASERAGEWQDGRRAEGGGRGPRAAGGPGCVGKLGTGGGAGCPGLAADVERRGGQAGEGPGSPSVSPTPAPQSVPLLPVPSSGAPSSLAGWPGRGGRGVATCHHCAWAAALAREE